MIDSVIHFNSNLLFILPATFAACAIAVRLTIAHFDYRTTCKATSSRLFLIFKKDIDWLIESVYSSDKYMFPLRVQHIVRQTILNDPNYPIMLRSYKRALQHRCREYVTAELVLRRGAWYTKQGEVVDAAIDFGI